MRLPFCYHLICAAGASSCFGDRQLKPYEHEQKIRDETERHQRQKATKTTAQPNENEREREKKSVHLICHWWFVELITVKSFNKSNADDLKCRRQSVTCLLFVMCECMCVRAVVVVVVVFRSVACSLARSRFSLGSCHLFSTWMTGCVYNNENHSVSTSDYFFFFNTPSYSYAQGFSLSLFGFEYVYISIECGTVAAAALFSQPQSFWTVVYSFAQWLHAVCALILFSHLAYI